MSFTVFQLQKILAQAYSPDVDMNVTVITKDKVVVPLREVRIRPASANVLRVELVADD